MTRRATLAAAALSGSLLAASNDGSWGFVPPEGRRDATLRLATGLLGAPTAAATAAALPALALTSEERFRTELFLSTSPSVLGISGPPKPGSNLDLKPPTVSGSGFVWDDSHIVTNFHVIAELTQQPHVTFATRDGAGVLHHTVLGAQIAGLDPISDTAILEVAPSKEQAVICGRGTLNSFIDFPCAFSQSPSLVVAQAQDVALRSVDGTRVNAGRSLALVAMTGWSWARAASVSMKARLMRPIARGESATLKPGQEVYALGNPFGLERSMSRGVISGVARTLEGVTGRPIADALPKFLPLGPCSCLASPWLAVLHGLIQTDASINPGNSGGPLLNSQGAVVGLSTAILSSTGMFSGIGLAIPIDTVAKNVNSMLTTGFVPRPSLGVVFAPDEMSERLGIGAGAMLMRVVPGGPASTAGLRATGRGRFGDVIVKFEGEPVGNSNDIFTMLENRNPGQEVMVSIRRASLEANSDSFQYLDVNVRLGLSAPKAMNDISRKAIST